MTAQASEGPGSAPAAKTIPPAAGYRTRYAILVVEHDGERHYVRTGVDDGPVAIYTSRVKAEHDAEFWRNGLGDEVQGISVVRYSAKKAMA